MSELSMAPGRRSPPAAARNWAEITSPARDAADAARPVGRRATRAVCDAAGPGEEDTDTDTREHGHFECFVSVRGGLINKMASTSRRRAWPTNERQQAGVF